jgi:hypothetical protein
MSTNLPSYELASKLLRYEPETGKLFWRKRSETDFVCIGRYKTWTKRYSEKEAGSFNASGYRQISISGNVLYGHRLAWLLYYKKAPSDSIDHINGNKSDNRIVNLRCVSQKENMRNQVKNAKNTSGQNGVWWHSRAQKWSAEIKVNQKKIHLGLHSCKSKAVLARKEAEIRYGFHENHGRERAKAAAQAERMVRALEGRV